jgi:hypothetical protein
MPLIFDSNQVKIQRNRRINRPPKYPSSPMITDQWHFKLER